MGVFRSEDLNGERLVTMRAEAKCTRLKSTVKKISHVALKTFGVDTGGCDYLRGPDDRPTETKPK
jgi:hypothetical protein